MILVQDNRNRPEAPPWMAGAADLQCREGEGKRWWGIGEGYLCGPQERATWHEIPDGYSVAIMGETDPRVLARRQLWCPLAPVADLLGRVWFAPCLLSSEGERQFRTAYGEDYLPALTDVQANAEKVALAARAALVAAAADKMAGGAGGLPMPAAAHWAADLLASVNHVTPQVIACNSLLDDALIGGVLLQASGLMPRMEVDRG